MQLIAPPGERIDLAKLKSISVRKTFWHKVLTIRSDGETRKVIVTFARQATDNIREALKADRNLRNVAIG